MSQITESSDPSPDPSPDATPDFAALLRASAIGDETAFARIYDLMSGRMFGLCSRVLSNRALAEEVTQEAFVQIWTQAARFDADRGSAVSWMLTITHRRAVDRVRSSQATVERDTAYVAHQGDVEFDEVAERVGARLEAAEVREALTRLTPNQRTALELAYLGGHTHAEVAELTGAPLGTAKTRIRDGLIALRGEMQSLTGGPALVGA